MHARTDSLKKVFDCRKPNMVELFFSGGLVNYSLLGENLNLVLGLLVSLREYVINLSDTKEPYW